jgi:hypothetical protein
VNLTPPLKPLSRAYKHVKFGPGATQVMVTTPYDADLHVDALIKFRDGSTKTEDLSKRRMAIFCPESAGQRVDEMVLVASNVSTYRTMPQDKPIRVVASNLGCSRYVGGASGVVHTHYLSRNTTETWTATGLVYQRTPTGADNPNFEFKLMGGTVNWSYEGSFDGCAVSAGPVTLQLPAGDRSGGYLNIDPWVAQNPSRRYSATTTNQMPVVQGTAVCKDGTRPWAVRPTQVLRTSDITHIGNFRDVGADGVIEGTYTSDEATGNSLDLTYKWRLEPDG